MYVLIASDDRGLDRGYSNIVTRTLAHGDRDKLEDYAELLTALSQQVRLISEREHQRALAKYNFLAKNQQYRSSLDASFKESIFSLNWYLGVMCHGSTKLLHDYDKGYGPGANVTYIVRELEIGEAL